MVAKMKKYFSHCKLELKNKIKIVNKLTVIAIKWYKMIKIMKVIYSKYLRNNNQIKK